MKIFKFESGQKLKVTTADYDLLIKIAGERFFHVGVGEKPLIEQVHDSLKISRFCYIESIVKSFTPESIQIVNRLILNQLLKFTRHLQAAQNDLTE